MKRQLNFIAPFQGLFAASVSVLSSNEFHLTLIGAGVFLRLKHFFENRSLWLDEAWLALNIVHTSFADLLKFQLILPEQPLAPLGYTLASKLCVLLFGNHEGALRLLPLTAGICSIFLFFYILRKIYSPAKITAALTLFVFSPRLIYYSAELKQYSTDVFFALILWAAFFALSRRELTLKAALGLGFGGAASMWFANNSLFILMAIGIALLTDIVLRRQWRKMILFFIPLTLWAASFFVLRQEVFARMWNNSYLIGTWADAFPPMPLHAKAALLWTQTVWARLFQYALGCRLPQVAVLLFLAGSFSLRRKQPRQLWILLAPVMIAFTAALLQK